MFKTRRQRDTARRLAVSLETECYVLAAQLDAFTHEFERGSSDVWCRCGRRVDAAEHRTARWVRERYGLA